MADSNGMYVSQVRDFTVRTMAGHTLHFKKGEPRFVPPEVRHLMTEHAIMPVSDDIPVVEAEEKTPPPAGDTRRERIYEAVKMLVELNDPNEFTAGGIPKTSSVSKVAGFTVDASERSTAWERHLQETS